MGLMKGKVQFVIKKLMTENDFMNGDKSLLKKTEVLHKDHNYMNFNKKILNGWKKIVMIIRNI